MHGQIQFRSDVEKAESELREKKSFLKNQGRAESELALQQAETAVQQAEAAVQAAKTRWNAAQITFSIRENSEDRHETLDCVVLEAGTNKRQSLQNLTSVKKQSNGEVHLQGTHEGRTDTVQVKFNTPADTDRVISLYRDLSSNELRRFTWKAGEETQIPELRSGPVRVDVRNKNSVLLVNGAALSEDNDYEFLAQNEAPEKPRWVPDGDVQVCFKCDVAFSIMTRKHHCRGCGRIFCAMCSSNNIATPYVWDLIELQRMCDHCASWYSDFQVCTL